ncbi:hypothetical protein CDAR_608651 [Caerostris darwini]|uniref:Ycf15 n=1 Tax=Caerostris darwini TaxID=1538125 RepID=A0AAV4WLP0_9ARAC|nr:hypothetical protein CDAR_608651 [Caerostris darwini]
MIPILFGDHSIIITTTSDDKGQRSGLCHNHFLCGSYHPSAHRTFSEACNPIEGGRTEELIVLCGTIEYFSYPFSRGTAPLIRPIRRPNREWWMDGLFRD